MRVNHFVPGWMDLSGAETCGFLRMVDQSPPTLGTVGTWWLSALALSNLGGADVSVVRVAPALTVPTPGPFATVLDRALFIFRGAGGATKQVWVPGPIEEIFVDGSVIVDLANPLCEAFVAATLAAVAGPDGQPLTQCVRGRRVRVKELGMPL